MIKYGAKYQDKLVLLLLITDVLVVITSWNISYAIKFIFFEVDGYVAYYNYFIAGIVVLIIYIIIANGLALYNSPIINSFYYQLYKIFLAIILTNSIWFSLLFFGRFYSFSRIHSLLFIIISFWGLVLSRIVIYHLFKSKKITNQYRNIIIIGKGPIVDKFNKELKNNPNLSIKLIGQISNKKSNIKWLGTIDQLEDIIENTICDEAYIIIDSNCSITFDVLDRLLKYQYLNVNLLFNYGQKSFINPEIYNLKDLSILIARQYPLFGINAIKKKLIDIIGSLILIILFLPFWIIIAILIKATSKGSIIYKQTRMGIDGNLFSIYKFRTMHKDAEKNTGATWATSNDKRTTYIGRFLRMTSLDETPQFINVFTGHMSLVGPRPERPELIELFRKKVPYYMSRHKIKSGITGWAQVNGWRGNTSIAKRIEYDLFYLSHWSMILDFKIMWLTIFQGFINKNAY